MPAKDKFHDVVKHALIKEGWTITQEPLYIGIGGVEYYIDLGAEKVIAAEKNGEKIAVEVKSFVGLSAQSEFHTALGQYLEYLLALEEEQPDRTLYLAVPVDTYQTFFSLQFIQKDIMRYQLKLVIYNTTQEAIVTWKK